MVERLLGAGYRPTVWRNVAPPYFLGQPEELVEVFDPINHYSRRLRWGLASGLPMAAMPSGGMPSCRLLLPLPAAARQPSSPDPRPSLPVLPTGCRLVFVARGGACSTATHHHWPDAFKDAALTLLLAGSHMGSTSSDAGSQTAAGGPLRSSGSGRGSHKRSRVAPRGGASKARRPASRAPAGGGCRLAALPSDVLLRILHYAALPMYKWL